MRGIANHSGMLRSSMLAALVIIGPAAAWAQAGADPLHSAGCTRAMNNLQAQESATAASAGTEKGERTAALMAARKAAALACLGASPDALPPRPATVRAPTSVSPIVIPASPTIAKSHSGVDTGRPSANPPIVSITGCDAAGCTASDGSRLTRMGPMLMGPRGACTVQGSVLSCP